MNTKEKGNEFEDRAYNIVCNALSTGKFGLIDSQCKVFRNKGYYSKDRKSNILFDLTIELWPPNAVQYSLLYIVECKNYNHKIPVDDVEEFYSKIEQVSGANRKGVFIVNNSFQKSAYQYAKNKGIMIIQVLTDDRYNIVLHKVIKSKLNKSNPYLKTLHNKFENFLTRILSLQDKKQDSEIVGLRILSKYDIESLTIEILNDIDSRIINDGTIVTTEQLLGYFEKKYEVVFAFENLANGSLEGILGCYQQTENRICIDKSVVNTSRCPFILAHEIGHAFLHSKLRISQRAYDDFEDSEYNLQLGRHELKNKRHWIEWQANYFASCILMPEVSIIKLLLVYQLRKGIRNKGILFLDTQKVNVDNFHSTINFLSKTMGLNKTNIIYRLNDLGRIIYANENEASQSSQY